MTFGSTSRGSATAQGPTPWTASGRTSRTFIGDLPVTPEGDIGGGVAGSQRVDIVDLDLLPDASLVDGDSFSYVARICSNDRLVIFGFHIEFEPST